MDSNSLFSFDAPAHSREAAASFLWYPAHSSTGSRGYFANRGSLFESSHNRNSDPRTDSIRRAFAHVAHNPARLSSRASPASLFTRPA